MRITTVIYCTTALTICSLYAAQPIQPLFQQEFLLTDFQAILFTTLMMAPLGVAPLLYGYLLEAYSARQLVRASVLAMAFLEIWFSLTDSYAMLLGIRAAQGLLIPAVLTSLMSYISYTVEMNRVQQAIALYIASTILGGFLGRLLSGLFSDLFGWRVFFFLLGILFFLAFFLLKKLESDVKMEYVKPSLGELLAVFQQWRYCWLYCCIFFIFFTFSAMMNFLPFELIRIQPSYGGTGIGLLYIGYSMGIVVSVSNSRIRSLFQHETSAIATGIGIFGLGVFLFLVKNYWVMFGGMFILCSGMFMAHSLLSGFLNTFSAENKAVANGIYISSYYTGGTLGSLLPGYILAGYGWSSFICFLLFTLSVAFFCNLRLRAVL